MRLSIFACLAATLFLAPLARAEEAAFLKRPDVSRLVVADGMELASRIGPTGAFRANARGGPLLIEGQRRAYDVVAAGVASDQPDMIARGLSALEWGFSNAGPDGSFPEQRGGQSQRSRALGPRGFFVEAAARSLLLINDSPVSPALKRRAAALRPDLHRSATWLANTGELDDFFRNVRVTNQLIVIATGLAEAGKATDDPRLGRKAELLIRQVLERQRSDGTIPEKGGFDTNYQSVSLEFLARYADTLPDGAWKQQVLSVTRAGLARLNRAIGEGGRVDVSGNTRTMACGPAQTGAQTKGLARNALPLRLFYLSYVLNDAPSGRRAAAVQGAGQRFTHFEECRGSLGEGRRRR